MKKTIHFSNSFMISTPDLIASAANSSFSSNALEFAVAWLGFSAGADMIMATGRHIIRLGNPLPMPGLMIPESCCNLR